ncbi:MAG: beta-phosphoglucomutase [Halothermotrichaceae bacterium]
MTVKGIIFDLDGVIVSTDDLHYQAWKKMADQDGIYFDKKINNRLRGVSRRQSLEIILEQSDKKYSKLKKKELTDYKNNYYRELLQDLTPVDILPGVKNVMKRLKKQNYKLAVGSSSKNTKSILKQIGLSNFFDAVADGTDIENSKPAPDVFLIAAKRLKLQPEECAVVEDAVAGIIAANNANMKAIAIGDAVKSDRADVKLSNIKELEKHV